MRVPFFWLAKITVWAARPAGVSRLDMALFASQDLSRLVGDADLESRVHSLLGSAWKPFLEVYYPRGGDRTLLYARQAGRRMEILILSVEQHQAAAILARINPQTLRRWLEDPRSVRPGRD